MEGLLKQLNKSVVHMRVSHNNRICYKESGESAQISLVNPDTNEHILNYTASTSNTQSDRHTMNLIRRSIADYRNSDS